MDLNPVPTAYPQPVDWQAQDFGFPGGSVGTRGGLDSQKSAVIAMQTHNIDKTIQITANSRISIIMFHDPRDISVLL